MNTSLNRLRGLPPDTRVYCGHEYTAANLKFSLAVEPENRNALEYQARAARLRAQRDPTLPSEMSLETRVNPFLRCETASVRAAAEAHAGRPLAGPVEVFAVLRAWKDQFR
jgi:hydroxyacylglutathione hydrolase